MNRYYLEVRYQVIPVDAVDEHTDAMLDALSVEPNLIDPDVGADLRRGWVAKPLGRRWRPPSG